MILNLMEVLNICPRITNQIHLQISRIEIVCLILIYQNVQRIMVNVQKGLIKMEMNNVFQRTDVQKNIILQMMMKLVDVFQIRRDVQQR